MNSYVFAVFANRTWFCRLIAGASMLVVGALLGCGGGSSGGSSQAEAEAASPQMVVGFSSTLTEATLSRVARVATSSGAIATTTPRAGATLAVPQASASPLVLAADAQGRLLLATLASESELSASNTAVALLWMWIKPVAGGALDDKTFASTARRAAGFETLVTHIDAALAAGTSPVDSLPVLTTLGNVAATVGVLATPQSGRMHALAEIARPRLTSSATLLTLGQGSNNISGNIFVKDTGNLSVFNGTALYWSAYTQSYDGKRVDPEADLLSPVPVADAIRYTGGVPPASGYTVVLGHPSVSYDLVVVQDQAARRANAVMLVRTVLQAILGTTALAFGEVSCLNDFIGAVAPAELDVLAANADVDAIQAYLSAYQVAVAKITLKSLTVSASCGGGKPLLESLTKHMPLIQIGLSAYKDGFAKVAKAEKVGTAIGTWIALAQDLASIGQPELKLGVCVAGGRVVTCATRYELKDNQPWLEGARAVLPLVAFAGDKATLVPSTLAISSQNLLPLTAGPETVVQVLSADLTTNLRIRDEPTGHDSSTVSLVVEPGKIQYVSLLGSATSGPFNVGQSRALSVVSNSNASQFYADVGFDWRVAPGSEGIVELSVGGQRLAAIKALKPGKAVIYATNSVTGRRLEFPVEVEFTTDYWSGQYRITSCSPLIEGTLQWYWANPCYDYGLLSGAYGAYFYFSDSSSAVVIGTDNGGGGDDFRGVLQLGWKSTDSAFGFDLSTSYYFDFGSTGLINANAVRKTKFTVTARTATSMSGTFTIEGVGGSFLYSQTDPRLWVQAPTVSSGTWSAQRLPGKGPQTDLMGAVLCGKNNVGYAPLTPGINGAGYPLVGPPLGPCKYN